ncbi:MAG: hypothetical protein EOP54_05065 [Sphingobacteriales bacterium]|nr:MAG: hypothetical protein EOP54_05065 [Sphingobacteriales bacterium]
MRIKLKQALLVFILIAAVLILFLLLVVMGNQLSPQRYTAAQYLLWLLSGLLSFVGLPFIAYISYTKPGAAQHKRVKWDKTDNLFFAGICLPVAIVLFWAFGNLAHHQAIYHFFVGIFGKGWRGNPNFPIPLLSFLVFGIFAVAELLHNKIRYKVYEFPGLPDLEQQKTFRRRRSVYYSIALATCVICFISYYLRWVILIE